MALRWLVLALVIGCGAPKRPTVTGADLYARVEVLKSVGQTVVDNTPIRKDQVLITGRDGQVFVIEQIVENCRGGDAVADVDCTLALLINETFTVLDKIPDPKAAPKAEEEDRSGPAITAIVVVSLAVGAIGGLVYGAATCEFEGCEVVFGVPLVIVAGGLTFGLLAN